MWPFRKKVKQRRLEVRRNIPADTTTWAWLRQPGGPGSLLMAAVFYVLAMGLLLWPLDPLPCRQGQYVPQDIVSRVKFEVLLEKEKAEAIERASKARPAMFRLDTKFLEEVVGGAKALPSQYLSAATPPAEAWENAARDKGKREYDRQVSRLREELVKVCFVKGGPAQWEGFVSDVYIDYPPPKGRREDPGVLIYLDKQVMVSQELDRVVQPFVSPIREAVKDYLLGKLRPDRPLYVYDEKARQQYVAQEKARIEADPPRKTYEVGSVLVRASDVGALDEEGLKLLRREHEKFLSTPKGSQQLWGRLIGRPVLPLLATVLLCLYIGKYQPRLIRNHWRGLALAAVALLMLALARVMVSALTLHPYSAVAPVIAAALVMTIVYGQRFAFVFSGFLSLLIVLQVRGDFTMITVLLVGAAGAIVRLQEVRTRSRLIEMGAVAGGGVLLLVLTDAAARAVPWPFALADAFWGAGFAVLAGFVVQGLLPLIERLFHIATSMTLLEWCDASRPLLKRLAMECPGTYNHSLQLGTMGEAAAEAVGARGLLARVGAYYHDIGKINKPDYFAENVGKGPSRHDKLSPAMSLLIIIGHVKDGIEIAREYGLPRVLHEFIGTHHGTTLIQSFYHAAAEQRKADSDRAPDEVEFRYPGPKPYSKEAAILMLADACESSVRALQDPTPGQIDSQVHTMVSRRLMDGQLDECELTLREVHLAEESLLKSLCSIYHSRIAYPALTGQKPAASEVPNGE
jgi:putative nucleotidyltransferase with HDIG domain